MIPPTAPPPRDAADLAFLGGTVLTFDKHDAEATALVAKGGTIVYVGSDAGASEFIDQATRVIDLAGRTIIPGINESHFHATWLGAMWPHTVMGSMSSAGAHQAPKGLETSEERRAAILRAGDIAAELGITSYTEPAIGPGEDHGLTGACGSDVLAQYRELAAEGRLRARINVLMLFGVLDGPSELSTFAEGVQGMSQTEDDPEWLRIAGVKIFADGIAPMRSAWIHGRYADGSSGGLLVEGKDLAEREHNMRSMIALAHAHGYQVGVHATGDRSIDTVAEAVAEAKAIDGADNRHYIIHGDLVSAATTARLAELGMGLNVQAGLAPATGAMLAAALSEQAAAAAWPIAAAIGAGVPLCLSSDAPILSPDWRQGLADAAAWVGDGALGDRRQTMIQLLRCYTVNPAWQDHAESWKGTLEPGKVADLCVLEKNPLELDPADLVSDTIEFTVVGGRVVYERGA